MLWLANLSMSLQTPAQGMSPYRAKNKPPAQPVVMIPMSNLIESQQAGKISGDLLIQIEKIESSQVDETDKTDTEEEGETASTETDEESIEKMSVLSVDGLDCIGTLNIPALDFFQNNNLIKTAGPESLFEQAELTSLPTNTSTATP